MKYSSSKNSKYKLMYVVRKEKFNHIRKGCFFSTGFLMVYHLCNCEEGLRNYEQKNMTAVHSENNEKFKYYKEWVSGANKRIEK